MKHLIYILFLILYSCSFNIDMSSSELETQATDNNEETKLPNDIRWVTNASEYKILCEQIYKNAWQNLSAYIYIPLTPISIYLSLLSSHDFPIPSEI